MRRINYIGVIIGLIFGVILGGLLKEVLQDLGLGYKGIENMMEII